MQHSLTKMRTPLGFLHGFNTNAGLQPAMLFDTVSLVKLELDYALLSGKGNGLAWRNAMQAHRNYKTLMCAVVAILFFFLEVVVIHLYAEDYNAARCGYQVGKEQCRAIAGDAQHGTL